MGMFIGQPMKETCISEENKLTYLPNSTICLFVELLLQVKTYLLINPFDGGGTFIFAYFNYLCFKKFINCILPHIQRV